MEHSIYSEDPAEQAAGREIVKWLDDFMDRGNQLVAAREALVAQEQALEEPAPAGGDPWMAPDHDGSGEVL